MPELSTDVRYIKGVGEQRAKALARLGVRTLGDLLNYFPRAYEDRTAVRPIAELALDETACVRAMVAAEPRLTRVRRGLDLVKLRIVDESGSADVTFFNQSYVRDQLVLGESYVFYGKAGGNLLRKTFTNPVFEREDRAGTVTGRILPLYRLTHGISNKLVVSAVECALNACGDMLPELLPREQKEAVRVLTREMKKLGISMKTGARMLRIEKTGELLRAVYELKGAEETVDCEQVLMAAGRRTNLSGIDAQALGLALDQKKCIVVDDHMRTNLPGVYAIGDVVGGYQLAHAAYAEGEAALADILGEDKPYGTMPVPVCTYTLPVLASVGLTTEAAEAAGYEPVLGAFDYGANGMALAEGAVGRVFVVADKNTTKTLGVSIVGENSAEMIAFATAAVAEGWTTEQWEKTVVAHPSLCEMVREAALAAFGRSVHTA